MLKLPEHLHHLQDPSDTEFAFTMSRTIKALPEEVQDRFKALKVLYVSFVKPYNSSKHRTRKEPLMKRKKPYTESLSSSMTDLTKRSTLRDTRSFLERSHPKPLTLKSMRRVPSSSTMSSSRPLKSTQLKSRTSKTLPLACQGSGSEPCSTMEVSPVLSKRRTEQFSCTCKISLAPCTILDMASTWFSPSRRMTTSRIPHSRRASALLSRTSLKSVRGSRLSGTTVKMLPRRRSRRSKSQRRANQARLSPRSSSRRAFSTSSRPLRCQRRRISKRVVNWQNKIRMMTKRTQRKMWPSRWMRTTTLEMSLRISLFH